MQTMTGVNMTRLTLAAASRSVPERASLVFRCAELWRWRPHLPRGSAEPCLLTSLAVRITFAHLFITLRNFLPIA